MRLTVIGSLNGELAKTTKIAADRAVLIASDAEIEADANRAPDDTPTDVGRTFADLANQPAQTAEAVTRSPVGKTVAEVERDLILKTLGHCRGNRTYAANILGISIRTLRNRLKQYADEGVDVPMPRDVRASIG